MPSKNTRAAVLTPELERLVRETAERETITISAVIRRALLTYFFGPTMTPSNSYNHSQPTFPFATVKPTRSDSDLVSVERAT